MGSSFSRVPSQAAAKDGGVFLSSPRKDVSARGMLLRADAAADLTHSLSTDISMERRENTAQSSTLLTVFFSLARFHSFVSHPTKGGRRRCCLEQSVRRWPGVSERAWGGGGKLRVSISLKRSISEKCGDGEIES